MEKSDAQSKVTYDESTEEVVIRRKTGRKIIGRFSAIGPITNAKHRNRRGIMQVDVFDLLDQVSKGAFSVFNNLKLNRSEDNNVGLHVPEEELSKTDRESVSRRLRELKDVGLIRGMKKHIDDMSDPTRKYEFKDWRKTFIINPQMIRCNNHDEAVYLWDQCAKGGV